MGTSWHKCLEIFTGPDGSQEAVVEHLNAAYSRCPPSMELADWEVERVILLYSFVGWSWHRSWQQAEDIETIAREVHFERQVNNLYGRRGKIDQIIRWGDRLLLGEYKSTSQPIDSGSVFWGQLRLATQPTLYILEARRAQLAGKLESFGITATDPLISGVLYDVWKKPTIRPKKLTQAESKKFVESGEYFVEKFEIHRDTCQPAIMTINQTAIDFTNPDKVTLGKKAGVFAIRETPEMFGARLLADIREEPEKYFARKEIPRSDLELAQLDAEYDNIARITYFMARRNLWYRNENQCTARYRCSMHPICLNNLDVSSGLVPDRFKCLNKEKKS